MKSLTILQLNDSHAYFEAHQELFRAGAHAEYQIAGGYARISTIFNQIRQKREALAFDCGDTIHGTYAAVKTRGEALVPILNALDFDAMTAHWEFAYGPEQFKKIASQLKFPVLAVNCYRKGRLVFEPYTILECENLQIGVVGIAAPIVDKTMPPSFSKGLQFTVGNAELPFYIDALHHERVDLIVVISHLGFPQEMKLVKEVDSIDVLLSGHTHNRLYNPAKGGNTVVIQSGCHGSFVGVLDLKISNRRIVDIHHRLITVDQTINQDPHVKALTDKAIDPHRDLLTQVVGRTATGLNRYTVLESTMDNFLLQGLLDLTGTQTAFSNGWRYGAPVPPGLITLNDLYNIIPGNPFVSTVELTGEEVKLMLEENLEHTFAQNPYHQMGGYVKRCLGVNVYFKMENPKGHRIQELFIQGNPVKHDRVYTATFVTTQGVPHKYGRNRETLNVRAVEVLQRYLAQEKQVKAELRGSVVAV